VKEALMKSMKASIADELGDINKGKQQLLNMLVDRLRS
jgi:hypothetical protein